MLFSKGFRPVGIKKYRRKPDGIFWRRRRDSNPRASFEPAYALSRGASSPLEYFSMAAFSLNIKLPFLRCWRRGWDSNPWLFRVTGFQDRLLKPLGHLSTAEL